MAEFHPLPPLPKPSPSTNEDLNEDIKIPESLWKQYDDEAEQLAKTISRSPDLTAKVPSLDHTKCRDFDNVYEPSDDTFLLLDAIQYDLFSSPFSSSLASSTPCHIKSCVMEVGTGSGIPITFLVRNLEKILSDTESRDNVRAIATDINPAALRLAQRTAHENGLISKMDETTVQTDTINTDNDNDDNNDNSPSNTSKIQLEFVRCDLATPFLTELEHQVDCLIFNPPYVPTPDSEVVDVVANDDTVDEDKLIEASWAGGERGRRVVDRFVFEQLPKLLSKNKNKPDSGGGGGVAYMVTVDNNEPYELACILLANHGLRMKPLVRRRARNEYLTIQKITWADKDTEKKEEISE